jgi:hypothetical protein
MVCALDGHALLALWEGALAQPDALRGDAVLRHACDEDTPALTLGERNLRLGALHARLFGRGLDLLSHCPACGTAAQFSGDCAALLDQSRAAQGGAPHRVEADGCVLSFRLPGPMDVQAAAAHGDGDVFARHLLQRCVLACTRDGEPCAPHDLPLAVLDRLSQRIEALDPAACVSFALACPQCATRWDARLDLGGLLWRKLQAAAERLLLDIDTLARNYGWSESDVIALSPTRRAAYVQMATP